MTLILFIAVVILGGLLAETRQRLVRLEREFGEGQTAQEIDRWGAVGAGAQDVSEPPRPGSSAQEVIRSGLRAEEAATLAASALGRPIAAELEVELVEGCAPEDAPADIEMDELVTPDWGEPEPSPITSTKSTSFEDLFGRRLPIWAGGVTLLVAAVLLVKYSIDAGLLSPWVRITLGLLFGAGLIGAAELARRMERFVQDDRVAQSLAGAGVGSLYAATLAASNLYGLIAPGTAFVALAAITVLAMGLALRFGVPCAVLALVGGLATPALVHSGEPNVPLLSGYLAMVISSLTVLSARQRWFWLGVMALVGGLSWTALIIVMGALSQMSVLSVGLLVLVLGLALPFLTSRDDRGTVLKGVAAVAAALQLALLVSVGGYDALSWGLYGLLSLAFLWLTERVPALRPAMAVPVLVSLILAGVWPAPSPALFSAVLTGIVLIFGGEALWRLWRAEGTIGEAGRLIAVAIGGYVVALTQYYRDEPGQDIRFALLGVGFAALPALGGALGWRSRERQGDLRFPLLALAAGFLLIAAGLIGSPLWMAPIVIAAVASALLAVAGLSQDRRVSSGALVYLAGALVLLVGTASLNGEIERFARTATLARPVQALLRWGGTTLVWAAFAWRYVRSLAAPGLTVFTAGLFYGFVAQFVPAAWLAIAAATIMLALAALARRQNMSEALAPAVCMFGAITALWMLAPLGQWLVHALLSLGGDPMLATDVPAIDLVLRRLLFPAALAGLSLWLLREKLAGLPRGLVPAIAGIPALVGAHSLYKQIFSIDGMDRFVTLGLAERTVWESLLVGTALALWRWTKRRDAALVLLVAGLLHNLVYSLLLHDPLWDRQAVGGWPLVNLLVLAFGFAFAAPRLLRAIEPALERPIARAADVWHMLVMLLFAYSSLRQLFCGSLFANVPVGQVESIFWSILAVAMAIGWLLWGINRSSHSWRIGSLVLMLAAIAKVFLIDASGLEGLLRVASFLALGFSLIGIGWLYSRFLRADPA
jgi:hypothetical protein